MLSKTSDNEHTAPALRDGFLVPVHSAPLSVQHPVGPPVPQLPQRPEEGTKVPSSSRRQHAGDVLPDNPSRPKTLSDAKKDKHEVSSGVRESLAEPRDGEGLAGGSSHKNVD